VVVKTMQMLAGKGKREAPTRSAGLAGRWRPMREPVLDQGWVAAEQENLRQLQISDHFAIVPICRSPASVRDRAEAVYDLVVRRFLGFSSLRPNTW